MFRDTALQGLGIRTWRFLPGIKLKQTWQTATNTIPCWLAADYECQPQNANPKHVSSASSAYWHTFSQPQPMPTPAAEGISGPTRSAYGPLQNLGSLCEPFDNSTADSPYFQSPPCDNNFKVGVWACFSYGKPEHTFRSKSNSDWNCYMCCWYTALNCLRNIRQETSAFFHGLATWRDQSIPALIKADQARCRVLHKNILNTRALPGTGAKRVLKHKTSASTSL